MSYSAIFYPVGQGLFSEGYTATVRANGVVNTFRWIYDCGSVSDGALVRHAICTRPTVPQPNILAISHFDRDHISGIVPLLQHTAVDTLLLPYLSLEQRVSAAIRTGLGPHHPTAFLCLDPVGFLASHGGDRIRRVVFVPPGGEPVEDRPPRQDDDGELLDVQTRPPNDAEAEVVTATSAPFSVEFLREGASIRAGAAFEFVPYNDGQFAKAASSSFQSDVRARRAALLSGTEKAPMALREIRDRYDQAFGKTAFKRNVVSLFLYASPTRLPKQPVQVCAYPTAAPPWDFPFHHCCPWCCARLGAVCVHAAAKTGLLYTGDGFLNTAERYAGLANRLGAQRMANLACVQVPHHGSRHNGYPGLAAKLAGRVSVFSSDPKHRLGHPHREVRADFAAHGPCQVDRNNGLAVNVCM